jgi:hypothetical protein
VIVFVCADKDYEGKYKCRMDGIHVCLQLQLSTGIDVRFSCFKPLGRPFSRTITSQCKAASCRCLGHSGRGKSLRFVSPTRRLSHAEGLRSSHGFSREAVPSLLRTYSGHSLPQHTSLFLRTVVSSTAMQLLIPLSGRIGYTTISRVACPRSRPLLHGLRAEERPRASGGTAHLVKFLS